jgi:hypothetical protein
VRGYIAGAGGKAFEVILIHRLRVDRRRDNHRPVRVIIIIIVINILFITLTCKLPGMV